MQNPSTFDIDDEFENFMREAYAGLPEHTRQYRQSRRIFFAGMAAAYWHLMALTALNDDEAEAGLKRLQDQLQAFAKRVGQDKD